VALESAWITGVFARVIGPCGSLPQVSGLQPFPGVAGPAVSKYHGGFRLTGLAGTTTGRHDAMAAPILEVSGLTKRYGDFTAVDGLNLAFLSLGFFFYRMLRRARQRGLIARLLTD
jgi:hypothetical protein